MDGKYAAPRSESRSRSASRRASPLDHPEPIATATPPPAAVSSNLADQNAPASVSASSTNNPSSSALPSPPLSPKTASLGLSIVTFTYPPAGAAPSPKSPDQSYANLNEYSNGSRIERGASTISSATNTFYGESLESDPLLLRERLHPVEKITELRRRKGDGKQRSLAMGRFYEQQNLQIESMLTSMDRHIEIAKEDEEGNRTAIKIAIWASLIANVCLAVLQLYAAVSSLSLSFFATAIDAIFDPLANLVLHYCHIKAANVDLHRYPGGGSRFESIGEIIYSGVMASASVMLVAFSIQNLVMHTSETPAEEFHAAATAAVAISFIVKLLLFLYCYSIRSKNSQVRVLWEDHRNDVAINALGIFTSAAGAKIVWWIDPLGAIVIALILIGLWGHTLYGHFTHLAGVASPLSFLQLLTYKAMTFQDDILAIDNCIAYHSGPKYIVEVDIVMSSDTPLWKAHDISQALQDKLEELPTVERAFVHVDHEISHKAEHRKNA